MIVSPSNTRYELTSESGIKVCQKMIDLCKLKIMPNKTIRFSKTKAHLDSVNT